MWRYLSALINSDIDSKQLKNLFDNCYCLAAVAGHGKSRIMLNKATKDDLIVVYSSKLKDELMTKAKVLNKKINIKTIENVMTFGNKFKNLIIDEAAMVQPR